ncbi:MAG: hypothetical protein ABSD59_15595 [Terracidiphilus sp.]|jgi:hypothetical protein
MVGNHCEILVKGVNLEGTEQNRPVILQMYDDDFPARFLQDLSTGAQPQISHASVVNAPPAIMLYQPVQRYLNAAMVQLNCNTLATPPVDPRRILSAGIVVRRVYRTTDVNGNSTDNFHMHSAWMKNPQGQFSWKLLSADQEDLDPDPTQRPQLKSGQQDVDQQLAALALSTALTESTTPAFAAPPQTCAALHSTVVYGVIPTASSEMSDVAPASPPTFSRQGLVSSLPTILRCKKYSSKLTFPSGGAIDYRWLSDDFLAAEYPPSKSSSMPPTYTESAQFTFFHDFATALRMLNSVFDAFDPSSSTGAAVLSALDCVNVYYAGVPTPMGTFYQNAYTTLLSIQSLPLTPASTQFTMPDSWDAISEKHEKHLIQALVNAITPTAQAQVAPLGRYQDSTRYYKLRMFFRVKSESGTCSPKLVWSRYSIPFTIAPWHTSGQRPHAPIPLPDPNSAFLAGAKPNCSFQVPGSLMGAMQGATMSGLMNGSGGGPSLSLGWLCGFNIPLITICAFFVLNLFLSLLNIIFFWLPFIKICIPFPSPSDD